MPMPPPPRIQGRLILGWHSAVFFSIWCTPCSEGLLLTQAPGVEVAAPRSAISSDGGVVALLSEILSDDDALEDPAKSTHWRRFPHSIVAASLTIVQPTSVAGATGAKRFGFPHGLLVGFVGFVVLHFVASRFVEASAKETSLKAEAVEPRYLPPANEATPSGPVADPHSYSERLVALGWIVAWMATSAFFVIFNKWLFTKGGFPHPIYLTTFHMGTCFLVFWAVRLGPTAISSQIMPDADKVIPWREYLKGLLPIAVLYGYCLGAGNLAFMFSSVAFLQMIKPINVLFTSLAAFVFRLEHATLSHIIIVLVIFGGVSTAAAGDVEFSAVGCMLQLSACFGEGIRLALLQKVTTKDMKLDPVTTVYRFAPVAGIALCVAACVVEKPVQWDKLRSPMALVLNCFVALILNILIVTVIKKASAVVFTLGGILKDIGAIAASVFIFKTPIARLEVIGYCLSMFGIFLFKIYKDNLAVFKEKGFVGGFSTAIRSAIGK